MSKTVVFVFEIYLYTNEKLAMKREIVADHCNTKCSKQ